MGKAAIGVLFAVAVCALLVATALTVVVLTDDAPEASDVAAVAMSRPSPTTRPVTATRAPGLPHCLIGTWRTVDEVFINKFYTDQPAMQFGGGGRVLEFRPDGTAGVRVDNVVYTTTFRGNQLRIAGGGGAEFTWHATDRVITYPARTSSTMAWSYYDQRGLLSTQPEAPNPALNETDDYTCQGSQFIESQPNGYRATWVRVPGFGTYG